MKASLALRNKGSDTPQTEDPAPFGKSLVVSGFAIIAAFSAVAGTWLAAAPIQGAVLAPGVVDVASNVKTIQHLEGGIISEILVNEGDRVSPGQALIRLQGTASTAAANEISAQWYEAKATEARLVAERDGKDTIEIPPELKQSGKQAMDAIAGQESIFRSRQALLRESLSVLQQIIASLQKEIEGYEGQVAAATQKVKVIEDQLSDVRALYEKKLVIRTRLTDLETEQADVSGALSGYIASIGVAKQKMEETKFKIAEFKASTATDIVEQLGLTRAKIYESAQKMAAANDVLARTEIRAPIGGTVVGLKVHTIGGVIAAGDQLMDIVPLDDSFVVLANVDPLDVDQVRAGLHATIWLSAVSKRYQQPMNGDIQTLSADRLIDSRTGQAYYSARIVLTPESLKAMPVALQAGMNTQVMIETGTRSAWEYLSAPVYAAMGRALRE
ncbi:MAG: HlyD family type I secretion periplasmic adaptor subunit [Mesorhizobium sp.]|uniref:HlyD family type I secretion periplasmic adaptor subunit n=1 Tax=Mesorhizobium sp. TaxID=1871066 RepID=UPI000FE8DBE8|nr:HlyD family type I secretion periplasmic adaptor subunit [Mesorhizobium sp.]RWB14355.1 MAG: HlyD family type I secretion periplasmic adaptor subunit [Mesorhizobium sp.]